MSADAYLHKAQIYEDLDDIDMALQTLEEGLERTGNAQIKDKLVECYLSQAEEYTRKADYEEALEVYDKLLELDRENTQLQTDVGNCLVKYINLLMEQGLYDEARVLIEKYQDKVSGIDFQTILDEILVRENIDLLLEGKRYDEARALVEEQRNATDDADFEKMLASIEEQIVLAENSVWVDDLYEKMIAGDINAVFSIITASDFPEKCSVFKYTETYYSMEYTLLTSDEKVVGVYDYNTDDGYLGISVAYCVHDEDYESGRPNYIRDGDYIYQIVDGKREWLVDNKYHTHDGTDGELSAGEWWGAYHIG